MASMMEVRIGAAERIQKVFMISCSEWNAKLLCLGKEHEDAGAFVGH